MHRAKLCRTLDMQVIGCKQWPLSASFSALSLPWGIYFNLSYGGSQDVLGIRWWMRLLCDKSVRTSDSRIVCWSSLGLWWICPLVRLSCSAFLQKISTRLYLDYTTGYARLPDSMPSWWWYEKRGPDWDALVCTPSCYGCVCWCYGITRARRAEGLCSLVCGIYRNWQYALLRFWVYVSCLDKSF